MGSLLPQPKAILATKISCEKVLGVSDPKKGEGRCFANREYVKERQ